MIQIISGTNRLNSNSLKVSRLVEKRLKKLGAECEIMSLCDFPVQEITEPYGKTLPLSLEALKEKINKSSGLYIVCPEYNGSMPGILKYFIDHWSYPQSFVSRPVAFIGLGGLFGGLRPVEHLQQVFSYRNAFIFPERVFLVNVWDILDDEGEISQKTTADLLDSQTKNFVRFIESLQSAGQHANQITDKSKP